MDSFFLSFKQTQHLPVNKELLLYPAMAANIFAKELCTGKRMRVKSDLLHIFNCILLC